MLRSPCRIAAMREVVNKLARDEYPMIEAKDRVCFRDLNDTPIDGLLRADRVLAAERAVFLDLFVSS